MLMLCFSILLLWQATAFAHFIPKEELRIGGIGLDCTLGYVKEIYGEPKEVVRKETGKAGTKTGIIYYISYKYSDTFVVQGKLSERDSRGEEGARVVTIFIEDNSLCTPSGFTVGMPYAAVAEMFGEQPKITRQGITFHGYSPDRSGWSTINFHVDDAGTITAITLYSQD